MNTKAAVLYKLNTPLVIEDVKIPILAPGQTLVKILYSALCRSQLNEIKGLKGADHYLPHLLGHEASGIVEKIGSDVTKIKKGDYVVLSWIKGKGKEVPAAIYKKGNRNINSGAVATFSQYVVISENRLTSISRKIPFEVAALLGCAIATGGGVVLNTLRVENKSTIAIFGAGGVGSGAIVAAKLKKCQTIIAVDLHDSALLLAKKLGATHALKFSSNTQNQIIEISEGGVSFSVEATGNVHAMEVAFASLSNKGILAICGNVGKDKTMSVDPFEFIKGKKIVGSWGGHTNPDVDFPQYAQAFMKGDLPITQMIGKKYQLNEINQAFKDLEKNKFPGRLLIDFTSE